MGALGVNAGALGMSKRSNCVVSAKADGYNKGGKGRLYAFTHMPAASRTHVRVN